MFSDIEGFTSLSEELSPNQLAHVLGLYLEELSRIIQGETHGTIDKYIGDCVMALWRGSARDARERDAGAIFQRMKKRERSGIERPQHAQQRAEQQILPHARLVDVVAAHGANTISAVKVSAGFSAGRNLRVTLSGLKVNAKTFNFPS